MSGGAQKTKTKQDFKLPEWYETAAKNAINFGTEISQGGYTPWIGPDVAALAPASKAGFQGVDAMSSAFGMPTGASSSYLPEEQTFAGGVKGYSSFPGFEEAMGALKTKYPGMYDFLSKYNKISQGSSFNPSQATGFQDMLSPQFNAMTNALGGGGGSGGSGDTAGKRIQPLDIMNLINGLSFGENSSNLGFEIPGGKGPSGGGK
jgi:hypothetical protein